MNTVISLKKFREQVQPVSTVVLIDLHHDVHRLSNQGGRPDRTEALANCRAVLKHARACGFPVAFTRQIPPTPTILNSSVYPRWIEGFGPTRYDMIFDRLRPSCYGNADFSEMAEELGGSYVIAGQIGELACLSTVVDAFHRDHRVTVLSDALITYDCEPVCEGDMSVAVTRIISHYAAAITTRSWILSTESKARLDT